MECSRRELARLSFAGTVAAVPVARGLLGARSALAQSGGDAAVLEGLIRLEQRSAAAYAAAADDGRLGRFEPVARLFAEQEQEHVDGLGRALGRLGGNAPRAPGRSSVPATIRSALELETRLVAAYQEALGSLASGEVVSTATSIVANHAQHLVVLRQTLGLDPSPTPFVTG